jgi:glycosyltransferase involved in cell wall biosynthesis
MNVSNAPADLAMSAVPAAGGSMPLISVTMCTWNGIRFVAEQLDSLLAQDDPNFEIVACDDASTDGTYEYLQTRASDRLRVHRNSQRRGFNGNFAHAFGLACGDLIAPCDQDDYWQPHKLSRLRNALGNAALVYSDSKLVDVSGQPTGQCLSSSLRFYRGRDPMAFALKNCVSGHALLFRRDLLLKALPIPSEAVYYDWWLAAIAAAYGGVRPLMEPLVSYRLHQQMQSGLIVNRTDTLIEWHRQRAAFLEALAERLPVPHRQRALVLAAHLRCRLQRLTCPGLGRLIWTEAETLFYIDGGVRGRRLRLALDYATGIPLKRLFRPGKYRTVPAPLA